MQEKEIKSKKIIMRSVIGNMGYAKEVVKRVKSKYQLDITERVVYLASSDSSKVRYKDLIRMEVQLYKKEMVKLLKIK
jgi:hypothetical protein